MTKQNKSVVQNTKRKNFGEFTNLYSLSKTLRFSLIPVLTEEDEEKILNSKKYQSQDEIRRQDRIEYFLKKYQDEIVKDLERAEKYKRLKIFLTELHKIFIKESLAKIKEEENLDFSELIDKYYEFEKSNDEDQKKVLITDINSLKEKIVKKFGNKDAKGGIFEKMAKEWEKKVKEAIDEQKLNAKLKGVKGLIITDQNVLVVLKWRAGEVAKNYFEISDKSKSIEELKEEILMLVKYFNGWTTYFKNFNEIRKNLYKDDGRMDGGDGEKKISKANAGQITTRTLDDNLEIFVKNKIKFKQNISKLKNKNKNVENDLDDNLKGIFESLYYKNCLSQIEINQYNEKMGKVNSWLNKKAQELKEKVTFLKPLYKQLLLTDGLEIREEFREIKTKEDLEQKLFAENNGDDFLRKALDKSFKVRDLFDDIDVFVEDDRLLNEIFLDTNKLSFYSNQIFGSWDFLKNSFLEFNLDDNWSDEKKEQYKKERREEFEQGLNLFTLKEILDNLDQEEFKKQLSKGNFRGIDSDGKYKNEKSNFWNFIWNLNNFLISYVKGRERALILEENQIREIDIVVKELEEAKRKGERVDNFVLNQNSELFKKSFQESLREKYEKILELRNDKDKKREYQKYLNEYFDRIIAINKFVSLFETERGFENEFLNKVKEFQKENNFVSVYNNVRNYLTQKDTERGKIKLNFETQTLLDGWGYRTSDYHARILKRDEKYYLLAFNSEEANNENLFLENYEAMDYYQQKGQTLFGSSWKGMFGAKYKEDKKKFSNAELKKRVFSIIDQKITPEFLKVVEKINKIKEMDQEGYFDFELDYQEFLNSFNQKKPEEALEFSKYRDKKGLPKKNDLIIEILKEKFGGVFDYEKDKAYLINKIKEVVKNKDIYRGVDRLLYEITKLEPYFYKTSFKPLRLDEKGFEFRNKRVYLFQIYNKDFSDKKKEGSKDNLHTLYFKELFSKENEKKPIFKLSGQGEIFLNPAIEKNRWEKQDLIKVKNGEFKGEVYKHRRKTHNNIYLHLSTVLNNINQDYKKVNKKVQEYISENQEVKVLGIDRGEKELAYQCLLDKDGNIVGEIKSLNRTGQNIIDKQKQKINYHRRLDIKEKERMLARKSWAKIEGIKDLKKGYLSSIVRDIADTVVQEDAVVILEELNYGFKRGRIKIEKGIYQQFENALLNKLSYLVLDKSPEGVRNALQLVPEIGAQKFWGNQMGITFYTDAKFTSKTCPHCGFRKRGVDNLRKVGDFKRRIEEGGIELFYEKDKDRFRFEYDWSYKQKIDNNEIEITSKELLDKKEVVYSDVERSFYDSKTKRQQYVQITEKIKDLLMGGSLKTGIVDGNLEKFNSLNLKGVELFGYFSDETKDKNINLGGILTQFNSILNIRYKLDKNGNKVDHIHCPKCHFHTASDNAQKIKDGDANGAYNIARKGLMVLKMLRSEKLGKKIKSKDGVKSKDLKIFLKDWDKFTFENWDKKDWEDSNNTKGL